MRRRSGRRNAKRRPGLCGPAGALVFALTLDPFGAALAWGVSGHAIVAEIAQRHLSARAAEQVRALLGGNVSLASVAAWADDVALLRPQTFNLHFVNIPYAAAGYDAARDCRPGPKGDCVVAAIARYRAVLADPRLPIARRREALKFLVHFVADVHQPLHCAERHGDGGGTRRTVTFFGVTSSLHMVWDVAILERIGYDWGAEATHLDEGLSGRDLRALEAGSAIEWAMESHRAAVEVAYDVPADSALGEAYFERARPVVEDRLTRAGVRLARLLNDSL